MSFFRKVASAFVVIDDPNSNNAQPAPAEESESHGLDDITHEAGTLLAQLEGRPTQPGEPAGEGAGAASSTMGMTAEDVFRHAGVSDTPNSALRVLKLVAGLSMFPREQQVAMVRAMDAADDSWAEGEVIKDAKQRQSVLRDHLKSIANERAKQVQTIASEIQNARSGGEAILAELDKRIAELYARREQEAATTASEIAKLEQKQRELEAQEVRARQGIAQVIQALGGLLSFLGVPQGPEGS